MKLPGEAKAWAGRLQRLAPGMARRAAAVAVAGATLLAGAPMAFAGGGAGSGGDNNSGSHSGQFAQSWAYRDNDNGGFGGADRAAVQAAAQAMGVTIGSGASAWGTIDKAVNEANGNCLARFNEAHPDQYGQGQCRTVAVGMVTTPGKVYQGLDRASHSIWMDHWADTVVGKTFSNHGAAYTTVDNFQDQPGTTVNSLAEQYAGDATHTSVVVIMLNQYEPKPANYRLQVSTDQQSPQAMKVGSTDAVQDVVHASASGSPIRENVNATVVMHYDGQPDGYVGAKQAVKNVTLPNQGDARVGFAPADFGLAHWQEGRYWFDVQVPKQGRMDGAVDTPDRDPREQFNVSAVPPPAPVKRIQKGTSADRMVNRTTITTGTGRGGYELHLRDRIDPHGVPYSVEHLAIRDATDGRDLSGEFTMSWDQSANLVKADRTPDKGEMPLDHTVEWSFDVRVSKPDFSKVSDHATAAWNKRPAVDTGSKEFPTWRPQPDKSWVLWDKASKQWKAVIDPERTNRTGADEHRFLDGDRVASVVNATVAADLIEAPERFEVGDDWSRASYIFKADDVSGIRVYQAKAGSDRSSSVSDIASRGKDVTSQFTITMDGTHAVAKAKSAYLAGLKGMADPLQVSMLVPGSISFARGKGAAQVRRDFGRQPGDELDFCQAPGTGGGTGADLTNSAYEQVNTHRIDTNEPRICGYVPPVKKDVVSEASQGGDQDSVDGKVVYPGQKVEYQLTTQPKLPGLLAYQGERVILTDTYDQWLKVDKQTLELMDLNTGRVIPKSKYSTKWDDEHHMVQVVFTDQALIGQWKASGNPRIQLRFEGTIDRKAPTDHKVGNQWMLTVNNSLTPSNEVFNTPPKLEPVKKVVSSKDQSISIDGKTLLLGDTGYYRVTLDARQTNQAYKVWKLGIIDAVEDEYLSIDQSRIQVQGFDGKDYTKAFNIQVKDGIVYAFARTVDTKIPATGETVKGDPQPTDLQAYAASDRHDPLLDPAIDQGLLGRTYDLVLPFKVIKVTPGHVVKNTATQVTNNIRKATNEVSTPLAPLNPKKDVVVKVGGESASGHSIYKGSLFLYQLDSSILPADRAYTQADMWRIEDQLDPSVDQYTGQWAVYAARDLYKDGHVLAGKGERIAGSGFDSKKLGGKMFTLEQDQSGKVTVQATGLYRSLVSASGDREVGWSAYIQCKRLKVVDHHENRFTEYYNDKVIPSNVVWTRTPDMTPRLRIVKFDTKSGLPKGDRNSPKEALTVHGDTDITARIYNDSGTDPDTGLGHVYLGRDLHPEDATIAGDGDVVDWQYPDGWADYPLKPGKYVDIHGTLKGVTDHHTDRVKVTGTPLAPCVVPGDDKPFDPKDPDAKPANQAPKDAVMIDGVAMCRDTPVQSNTDDWNGKVEHLAITGSAVIWILLAGMVLLAGGGLFVWTIRRDAQGREHLYAAVAQPALAHALGEDQDGPDSRRDGQPR
ncbi:LPXTG cell wall anchor domain-containing protein [Bifidobacterium sp. B4001]|uniref:LPXTG cell wall anchor domain-containing protein n=1 Tax=unclassified Bifidobacterium TaxID=2608897 RepID=UPI00226BBD0F|nr:MULTISPECIES: LPXTG cell wall anchor domain-containing protein [unclassified Bifidobacterium]MCX8672833.1 LPXTG cell wall anchor domain-containing protein [Bifidobacterium sp. B4079]MCX8681266.1 LPXTG cell wall anchor domain-containing protein [Bifidobacterium sp. B4001]